MDEWLRIDEQIDTLVSLLECLSCLKRLREEPAFWKWAIISMHSALQGAMVCHLSGTAQLGALTKDAFVAAMEWHERDGRGEIKRVKERDEFGLLTYRTVVKADAYPQASLASPDILFKRLYRERIRYEGAGGVIDVTTTERRAFKRLNNFRRDFTHFAPAGWSIELAGLPQILISILNVIEKIASDPWPFRHMNDGDRHRLTDILRDLRHELTVLEARSS